MSALFSLAFDGNAYNVPPDFAVVADETKFGYVHPPTADGVDLDERAERFNQTEEDRPTTAQGWLELGASNMSYVRFTSPISADSYDAAVQMATDLVTEKNLTGEQDS